MLENQKIRAAGVIGPLGELLTLESLPPSGTTRWVIRRKAEVLAAVQGGLLSIEDVCERYDLSLDEFMLWQRAVERSGVPGLRVKQIQSPKAVHERQDKHRAVKASASAADVELADNGSAESQAPAHE